MTKFHIKKSIIFIIQRTISIFFFLIKIPIKLYNYIKLYYAKIFHADNILSSNVFTLMHKAVLELK